MSPDQCNTFKPMQGVDLQPQNLTILSGCGAIINNLIYCIAEPGEGIALPAPYYPAFDYDIRVSGLRQHILHLVNTWHSRFEITKGPASIVLFQHRSTPAAYSWATNCDYDIRISVGRDQLIHFGLWPDATAASHSCHALT